MSVVFVLCTPILVPFSSFFELLPTAALGGRMWWKGCVNRKRNVPRTMILLAFPPASRFMFYIKIYLEEDRSILKLNLSEFYFCFLIIIKLVLYCIVLDLFKYITT